MHNYRQDEILRKLLNKYKDRNDEIYESNAGCIKDRKKEKVGI